MIRMIAASTGVISTIAGNSTADFAGDGSLAVNAELNSPQGLAIDSAGNIYFADSDNNRIRAVGSAVQEPVTTMPTITWTSPASIDYGTALSATQLNATASVQGTFSYRPTTGAVLPSGLQALVVVFTPANQSMSSIAMTTVPLTVVAATPTITWPVPAPLPYGVPLGASQLNATANVPGTFSFNPGAGTILSPGTYTLNATFTPNDTAGYNSGAASVPLTVSILPGSGIIATLAGNGYWAYTGDGGPAINAALSRPRGMAVDAAGDVFFVDEANSVVRKVTASSRIITTIAGNGTSGYSGDGGAATNAEIGDPVGVALDNAGNVYIADAEYAVVRKVSPSTGVITTVAGDGVRADSGDGGPATSAELCDVSGVAADSAGNIYIADSGNNKIRKVDASTGIINTIAGSHVAGYSGDGGPATSAILNGPYDVVFDAAGNLYISDNGNNVVRKISTSGIITTVVGTGVQGFTGDGGPATTAELNSPRGIALDSAGNLYVADEQNCVIREVLATSGIISSVAGSGSAGFSGDGGSATSAQLSYPAGVAVDAAGNIYIGDSVNLRVRVVGTATASVSQQPASNPTITLGATVQPPYVVGASQEFVATVRNQDGSPLPNVSVSFAVTGVNTGSGSATTDVSGRATFAYSGSHSGSDKIQASISPGGTQLNSNTVSASWLVPVSQISTTSVSALFFLNTSNTFDFDIPPTATPVFTQTFPNITFNPPTAINGNTTVGVGTRPFTDVITDEQGNFAGTIVAGGNGYQPGVVPGNMGEFETVFTGSFVVASGGNAVISFYVDNSFILGIGGGATRVSGPMDTSRQTTPFGQLPVIGAFSTTANATSITVEFPGPGTYPYELDYVECCGAGGGDTLSLVMTAGAPNGSSTTPETASLTLTTNSLQPLPVGGQQTFTALATDAAGNPIPNLSVGLVVSYVDSQQLTATTDSTGHATFLYKDKSPGTAAVQAVALINGMVTYSNVVNVSWSQSPSITNPNNGGDGSTLSISVSAPGTVILPATLPLTATVSDSALHSGGTIALTWSEVSGPGSVTFTSPNSTATSASFSQPGGYVLKLSATDPDASDSVQIPITVNPAPDITQGWIGSPQNGSPVSGIVPITVATGETLQSGTLTFYPANNPQNVTVLNATATGSGQIGTLDTTGLANGQYWITLYATDTSGNTSYNLSLVTVVGRYKPGRVTSTLTDLVVPAKGLAINIQRTYDSLNAGMSGDFGYGWSLGTTVNLSVNPLGAVTFTLGGQRRTFYFTPQYSGFLPFYVPAFTPEPGMHGTLYPASSGCSDLFDYLVPDGSLWACVGGGFYTPPGYVYIDPSGTAYTMTANGQLQSITDKNGNTLTITTSGISSSTGLSVPFERDSQGRITKITDPQGNEYLYGYLDADGIDHGNLQSVTYPNTPQSSTYTYNSNHLYLSGTDFRNNPLPTTTYFGAGDTDSHGHPLSGKLESVTDALGETTSYAYDLTSNTTTVTYPPDGGGNVGTATMVYDTMGDLLSSTDPLGHKTTNTYDGSQNLLSTTDPLNHITCYTYDSNGNRTSVSLPQTGPGCSSVVSITSYNQFSEPTQTVDELGNVRTFNYDVNFNPQSVTDSLGALASFVFNNDGTMQSGTVGFDISSNPSKASQFTYDANGNMASRADALGRTTSYVYDSLGQKISTVEPLLPGTNASAAQTTYSYDAFGNLTQTAAPLGRTTSSTYDGNGNKLTDTDARSNTTSYAYDALNRLSTTTYPTSPTTTSSKTYDFRGDVVTETDQAGHVTKHVYDLAGRQTSVTQAYGTSNATTTTYAYDNAGRKTSETDALNHTTTYTYDAAGNLTGVSGVNGTFTYAYDNARNRISMTDGNNNTTQYQYDTRKRLVTTTYPDSTTKTNSYDGPGNLISVTDQNGNEVQYAYDAANQLQSVTQTNSPNAPNNVTSYGYNVLGDITGLTDANSHLTENAFDLLSQPVSKTLPDGTLTETRQYDAAGNLTSLTHFNGKTTTYAYDTLNRLLSRTPDPTTGEPTVSFTYTATGKRASMTDASGTTSYTYDSMDRLTQKATPEGTLNYTYDAAGHMASMTSSHTNGVSASYTYDSLNRLSTVVDAGLTGNQTTTYTYDDANNVATVTYPNSVQTDFSYDELNRVKQLATSQTGYLYTFDAVGNRKTASELNGRSVSWNFDGIYRLTQEIIASAPGNKNGTADYGLDPVGNRSSATSSVPGLSPVGGTFNADDELSGESYDSDGNVTASGGKTFAYDTENHLLSMNGGAVTILYDGDGNRVAKTVSGVTTRYLVDDLNPTGYAQVVEELSSGGAVERQYTYGLERISQNQVVSNTWTPSFYGYDGFGTVRQLTNSAGAITDTYDYDAFGNKINSSGSTPNNYRYRGEQFDSDLGLYYLRARYYNPITGRFMSRDPEDHKLRGPDGKPIDPRELHKYLYADGDPVNGMDPTGRGDSIIGYALSIGERAQTLWELERTERTVAAIMACVADLLIHEWDEEDATDVCFHMLGVPDPD